MIQNSMATVQKILLSLACVALLEITDARAEQYVAVDPVRSEQPPIVLFHQRDSGKGFDWEQLTKPRQPANLPESRLRDAVVFLQEGVRRMTGVTLRVQSGSDLNDGIVLVLADVVSPQLKDDTRLRNALQDNGMDSYNHVEAYYLRSERNRLLVVANTVEGLIAAMPALLESVGYEVLGMGPNWIHVPKNRQRLVFDIDTADRPSYYLRQLTATSGQQRGVGTIKVGPKLSLTDSADESVDLSYDRWSIGIRNHGRSMAAFPGHAMYQYHRRTVEEMLSKGSTDGFLTPKNHLGRDANRPTASAENASHLWINTDAKGEIGHGLVYLSNGKQWTEQKLVGMNVNADVSSPLVRHVVFEEMKLRATKHFAERGEEPFVFATEPEDGAGYQNVGKWMREANRNWYPDYLRERGIAWPQPYILHGYHGIQQPQERWDYSFPADIVFAFNNWLLSEFDLWIDRLPAEERVTKSGRSKKELVRCSCYSYAFHDVPPHINLDPRIRVMIAGYPKHRGLAEWKAFASQHDVAAAFKRMLPREPSGEYRIISLSYYADFPLEGLPAKWSAAPNRIVQDLRGTYDAGIRALTYETDFNFGKYGLAYYLISKFLWNARLTVEELDSLRDRWLQRAYGSGWREMKKYYDFMLIENYPANASGTWAKAIRIIDEADAKIDSTAEPECQRRLDDLKQFWYYYYLMDTDRLKPDNAETAEFLWKGQMSYMTAMHAATEHVFGKQKTRLDELLPLELRRGPAHYTPEETAAWWKRIHDEWPAIEVSSFTEATLANGKRGRDVDLNDLVRVSNFEKLNTGRPFHYNSAQAANHSFVTVARSGDSLGFSFSWPANDQQLRFYGPKDVPYGVEFWDVVQHQWIPIVDVTTSTIASKLLTETLDGKLRHEASVSVMASRPGTYRIEVGRGGFLANLASLGYNPSKNEFTSRPPQTYASRFVGLTQDPVYLYVPKGTVSLDLENWSRSGRKQLQLYRGMSEKGLVKSRLVDIGKRGTHRISLEASETGNLAQISGDGFAFPLLYSIPSYWAKCPAELVIPRAIAEADGLQIVE